MIIVITITTQMGKIILSWIEAEPSSKGRNRGWSGPEWDTWWDAWKSVAHTILYLDNWPEPEEDEDFLGGNIGCQNAKVGCLLKMVDGGNIHNCENM